MLEQLKVATEHLELGMYVSELDRPWLETPFLMQGFRIDSEAEIQELSKWCAYVYVDVQKSDVPGPASPIDPDRGLERRAAAAPSLHKEAVFEYTTSTTRAEELQTAKPIHQDLEVACAAAFKEVLQTKHVNLEYLQGVLKPMVDSVIRNPDAFILLTQLRVKDSYAYSHAMACSVLAVAVGRQIGLPKEMIQELALGALVFDLGRVQMPASLLAAPRRFSQKERFLVEKHVEFSLSLVRDNLMATPALLDMVATHHERHNGSGYPKGLKGEEIPLFGRIAGLVDSYDAITSERPYASPLSPSDAMRMIYGWRDTLFQGAVIEQLIQVIGIYPLGTIVELSDGRVGVIVKQYREARMRPVVMLLLDAKKRFLETFEEVDLRNVTSDAAGRPLQIVLGLPRGSYNIDPAEYFL